MTTYHQRRPEKTITDEGEILDIIDGQAFMTLAMCKDNEPYLVTVNYGFDPGQRYFYFHCAPQGKKMDFLRANPIVWGQVLEDRGYLDGECNHAFSSVYFRGRVTFLETAEDKLRALDVMLDHLESDPAGVKQRQLKETSLAKTALAKVQVEEMTGKTNPKKS
jgi:nitroimidazol reductase NimA-like FMN-containing flavoprotein (pyridoxamine 5'-phosphate oxidase superfamily)